VFLVSCFIPSVSVLFHVLWILCPCYPSLLIILFAFRALVDCNSFEESASIPYVLKPVQLVIHRVSSRKEPYNTLVIGGSDFHPKCDRLWTQLRHQKRFHADFVRNTE
jgi:hypothetical protein